jgi:hypothetical protein
MFATIKQIRSRMKGGNLDRNRRTTPLVVCHSSGIQLGKGVGSQANHIGREKTSA